MILDYDSKWLIFSRGRINHQVGTIQTIFDNTRRRGASWRDQEEAFAQYELTEVAEMLLERSADFFETDLQRPGNLQGFCTGSHWAICRARFGECGRSKSAGDASGLEAQQETFPDPTRGGWMHMFFLIVKQWYLFLNNNINNSRT